MNYAHHYSWISLCDHIHVLQALAIITVVLDVAVALDIGHAIRNA
jgi:hypothetical protein